MKKIASLTALLFFLAAPSAHAYDFGTAGIVAAVGGAGAGLALVFGAPAALGTVAIGAAVAGLTFALDPASNQSSNLDVQLSPAAVLPVPPGWKPAPPGSVEPVAPDTLPLSGKFRKTVSSPLYDSPDAACANETNSVNQYTWIPEPPSTFPDGTISGVCKSVRFSDGYVGYSTVLFVSSCPSGYSVSNGSCVKTDESAVQKPPDDRCGIKRTGNSFAVDPRDPDCASGKIPATTAVQPNIITSNKPDGSSKSIQINPDGSSTVNESRPNNGNNTTETNTTTLSAPDASGASKVTGQGSGVAPGTGTQAGTSTTPVNVNFDKAGLATEGTLTGIKTDTAAIKDALSPKDVDSSLGDQKSALDTAMDGLAALFGAEVSKSAVIEDDFSIGGFLPAQCGCAPLTMTILGKTASYNWCGPMETFKGVFSWVIGLLTALYVLSLFRLGGGK
ncbi:hypothetical protein [Thiobacillus sp. 65-1402]|uniref:hypothetical protein n=1 Tax=Thiobacillus sp. 65-1402 TaxID=1895861 RepID=UPI0025CC49C2|nr:hypothetical protein [Thiobacillus sp. 65-1402]